MALAIAVFVSAANAQAQETAAPDTGGPSATGPGSVVKGTHGAWQVSCRTPPGAKDEKCAQIGRAHV